MEVGAANLPETFLSFASQGKRKILDEEVEITDSVSRSSALVEVENARNKSGSILLVESIEFSFRITDERGGIFFLWWKINDVQGVIFFRDSRRTTRLVV